MTITLWILFALFWLLQPILCYGMLYAYSVKRWPMLDDNRKEALKMGLELGVLTGPIATGVIYYQTDRAKHGLKFR